MALSGARKAAMLLMCLDPASAAELLKSTRQELMTEILAELTYLRSSGAGRDVRGSTVQEFLGLLRGQDSAAGEQFMRQVLDTVAGKGKSAELLTQVRKAVQARDPFVNIRTADVSLLAGALKGESPAVAALVLGELPPEKSSQLLGLLDESVRSAAVRGLAGGEDVSPEARLRVAAMVQKRLGELAKAGDAVVGDGQAKRQAQLRKVALLLRGVRKDSRDSLVDAIRQQEAATADAIMSLMVVWEDMPRVADRVLQETLRTVDGKSLALSMVKADEAITRKIRSNISERAAAMLDEEASLLSAPKVEDVEKARQNILDQLRALNVKGELTWVES